MKILFVCSGNTCRSPMAAAIAARVSDQRGLDHEFDSAGTHVSLPEAEQNAIIVAEEHGSDLRRHRPTQLTSDLLKWADKVFIMTEAQREQVAAVGEAKEVSTLGVDVRDPFGSSLGEYRALWQQLELLISQNLT